MRSTFRMTCESNAPLQMVINSSHFQLDLANCPTKCSTLRSSIITALSTRRKRNSKCHTDTRHAAYAALPTQRGNITWAHAILTPHMNRIDSLDDMEAAASQLAYRDTLTARSNRGRRSRARDKAQREQNPADSYAASDDGDSGEVEALVDHRVVGGRLQYRVRWVGASPSEDQWFWRDELVEGAEAVAAMVARYESHSQQHATRGTPPRATGRRLRRSRAASIASGNGPASGAVSVVSAGSIELWDASHHHSADAGGESYAPPRTATTQRSEATQVIDATGGGTNVRSGAASQAESYAVGRVEKEARTRAAMESRGSAASKPVSIRSRAGSSQHSVGVISRSDVEGATAPPQRLSICGLRALTGLHVLRRLPQGRAEASSSGV